MKAMFYCMFCTAALVFSFTAVASATITVTVGSAQPAVGTTSVTISVFLSRDAGEVMGGEQFIVGIGPFNTTYPTVGAPTAFGAGANSGQILSYDLSTGTVWGGTDLGASPASPPAAGTRKVSASDASKNPGGTVAAQGLLGRVIVDVSNLPTGDYEVRANAMSGGSGATKITNSDGTTTGLVLVFAGEGGIGSPGYIHIVPEPSTVVLGLFAAAALAAYRWRRKRQPPVDRGLPPASGNRYTVLRVVG